MPAESDQTTHYSVVDGDGMAVSVTYTLEQAYGSRSSYRAPGSC
jgi:gamma-glutamyltranspeptidase / glutathione hydrolase